MKNLPVQFKLDLQFFNGGDSDKSTISDLENEAIILESKYLTKTRKKINKLLKT